MTAIRLTVALRAVLGYICLMHRSKRAMEENRSFGADLQDLLMSSPQAPKIDLGAMKPFDEAPPFSAQNAGSSAAANGVSRSCARLVAAFYHWAVRYALQ